MSGALDRVLIGACLISALASACTKLDQTEPAAHEPVARKTSTTHQPAPPLGTPQPSTEAYKPSASEVPLTEDFATAADKRVTPDNYRQELITIEQELAELGGTSAR